MKCDGDMNKEFFNLRSLEFRQYIIKNYHYLGLTQKQMLGLLSWLLDKESASDGDLIRLYLILVNVNLSRLDMLLFDYKMGIISDDRVDKFLGIVMDEAGFYVDKGKWGKINYHNLNFWVPAEKFYKLVDIFLDEI